MKNNTIVIVVVAAVVLLLIFMMMNRQQQVQPQAVVQQPEANLWSSLGDIGNIMGMLGVGSGGTQTDYESNWDKEYGSVAMQPIDSQEAAAQESLSYLQASVEGSNLNEL